MKRTNSSLITAGSAFFSSTENKNIPSDSTETSTLEDKTRATFPSGEKYLTLPKIELPKIDPPKEQKKEQNNENGAKNG